MRTRALLLAPLLAVLLSACPARPPDGRPPGGPSSSAPSPTGPAPTTPPPVVGADGRYDVGEPALTDVWVDPVRGDDANSGATRAQALRTIDAAWRGIAAGEDLRAGVRIALVAGRYGEQHVPSSGWFDGRYGTHDAPIVVESVDGPGAAVIEASLSLHDVRFVYLLGVSVSVRGDALHCERCDHVLLREVRLDGHGDAHETFKANQSSSLYIEDSDISGAYENAIDYVAVQYGHIVGSRIHDADDWCAYAKGGSAYIRVEANEIFACGTGGFTAGQGTGFEYMVRPWLQYEAYGIRVVNNLIHDTDGAGLGVSGGYDVFFGFNTLYRVGARSHVLELALGARSCDGETAACEANRRAGGWGTAAGEGQFIPNRHVYLYGNVVFNPEGFRSQWQQLFAMGPVDPPAGSGAPSPSRADDDLRIVGNVIWNGPGSVPLGLDADSGCQAANPTCNATQLEADNWINVVEPDLLDPGHGDFRPRPGGRVATLAVPAVPAFSWADAPAGVPAGGTDNSVGRTYLGEPRDRGGRPGAM